MYVAAAVFPIIPGVLLCVCQVDVSGAYDSLPHQKLVEVLGEVLHSFSEQSFFVRQYARVWNDPHLGVKKHFCTRVRARESVNQTHCSVCEMCV